MTEKLEMKVIKAIRGKGVSEMKTIRCKVIFAKCNHVQTTVYEIYGTYNLLPQYNTVRICKMYKNNLTV